jgi:hypothetical protein
MAKAVNDLVDALRQENWGWDDTQGGTYTVTNDVCSVLVHQSATSWDFSLGPLEKCLQL